MLATIRLGNCEEYSKKSCLVTMIHQADQHLPRVPPAILLILLTFSLEGQCKSQLSRSQVATECYIARKERLADPFHPRQPPTRAGALGAQICKPLRSFKTQKTTMRYLTMHKKPKTPLLPRTRRLHLFTDTHLDYVPYQPMVAL